MAYKPFKMKGSPMKRNFGIGPKSPAKHGELGETKGWHEEYSEHDGTSEHWHPVSGNTSYSDKGSKQETEKEEREAAAEKESPAKRSFIRKARDEAKQVARGLQGTVKELDKMGTGVTTKPIKAFKEAYRKETDKQKREREAKKLKK